MCWCSTFASPLDKPRQARRRLRADRPSSRQRVAGSVQRGHQRPAVLLHQVHGVPLSGRPGGHQRHGPVQEELLTATHNLRHSLHSLYNRVSSPPNKVGAPKSLHVGENGPVIEGGVDAKGLITRPSIKRSRSFVRPHLEIHKPRLN